MTRTFARYCGSSFVSLWANIILTWGFHELGSVRPEAAFALAIVIVFFLNFLLSRYFVYRASSGPAGWQLRRFALSVIAFRVSEYGAFLLLHLWLGVPYLIAVGLVLITSFLIKFFFFSRCVFVARSMG